ncbi:MAG: hypothetical protein V2B15_01295 [Bacteroidota bacterium]
MAGYDQHIIVNEEYLEQTRSFLYFLKNIGKKYSRPTKINFRYVGNGKFYILIDGRPGGIDALFQELILNKGLYYYSCTLNNNKKKIISNVILPVFRQLIDERFENPQTRFLRNHILGKYSQNDFVPTEISNKHGYEYEILFRRWDLAMVTIKDYVISLDALLTQFLLEKNELQVGERSPYFGTLLKRVSNKFIMGNDVYEAFDTIHRLRTYTLHRLQSVEAINELDLHSMTLYNYFHYLDEYIESQKQKTVTSKGKRYRRVRYGDEIFLDEDGNPYCDDNGVPYDWNKITSERPCNDCGVLKGEYHVEGCDIEICPKCGGQLIGFHKCFEE